MVLAIIGSDTVTLVARRFVRTTSGVVGFRLHRVFDVHAGPQSRHDDLVLEGVYQNGTLVKVRIVSDSVGGRELGPDQKAEAEQQWEHPKYGDVFLPPFDPRYSKDYRFQPGSAPRTMAFTALVRDAAHGDGSFVYDAGNNVISYSYSPCVLPKYASTGTVSDLRARVLPSFWGITGETQQYRGRYSLWSGGATVEMTYSNFRRFATLQEALQKI